MYLQLVRESFTENSTEGKLFVNGTFQCYTLEDTDRRLEDSPSDKLYGKTCIPRGSYTVVLTQSPRFKKVLPEILDVTGFSGVRIHSGNSAKDTEGCILVGMINTNMNDDWIGSSKAALVDLMAELESAVDTITLEII